MSNFQRLTLIQSHLLSNFPSSTQDLTLSESRSKASKLNPSLLAQHYYGSSYKRLTDLRQRLKSSPLFNNEEHYVTDLEFTRGPVIEQLKHMYEIYPMSYEKDLTDPLLKIDSVYSLAEYSLALATRAIVHLFLYIDSLQGLGTEKHRDLINRAYKFQDYGCFAMTELGHGSNVSMVETIATYDPQLKSFILNSPTKTSAKWWIGALSNTANMAVVFAQLFVEKVNRGVHVFVIPIRDYKTHQVIPGLIIGDCGKKTALDGIDNGFMLFNNYQAPYDCLLDRFSQIRDGKFKSGIKNKDKRLGVMMAGLVRGRLNVAFGSEINARTCVTIALRYAGLRKQFGGQFEKTVLNYQTHNYRLVTSLAKVMAIKTGANFVVKTYSEVRGLMEKDPECEEANELHSLLSALKVVGSTLSTGIGQECRIACGGHGFSSYAGIGKYRGFQDVHNTWEGDNHVLIQQTGRYILKILQKSFKGQNVAPKTLSFLRFDFEEVKKFNVKFANKEEARTPQLILELLQYRINVLMHQSVIGLQENSARSEDMTDAWNRTQVFLIQDLGHAYGELLMATEFFHLAAAIKSECSDTGAVVEKLALLFAIDRIVSNASVYLEGALNHSQEKIFKNCLLDLCEELAFTAIAVVDALAQPDELIGSAIGNSDGQAYERMVQAVEKEISCYEMPSWIGKFREMRGG